LRLFGAVRLAAPVPPARSLSDLLRRQAARAPGRLALIGPGADGPGTRLTWAELDGAVNRAAAALRSRGLADGDRVVLHLSSGTDLVVLYLGSQRAGLVAVPANAAYTAAEVDHIATDCTAQLVLDDTSGRALMADAPDAGDPELDRVDEDVAVLLYTSGTSGAPRGAMLSTRALLANLEQVAALDPAVVAADDVVFVPLPLTHVYGLNAGLGNALYVGATTVLADRFDADATLATMAAEGVTVVVGVPGQYAAWLRSPGFADGFARVHFAMSGSATLAVGTVLGYRAAGIVLHDGYGLTEAAPVVTVALDGRAGTVGRPLPGVEVELRDEVGEPVEPGDPGRVHVRGANLFSGYWPSGDDGPDSEGWFATGDVGVFDDDGALRLVGRANDLVIVNGFNVYPAEVEAVIAAEPGVAEVAVVGEHDAQRGEAVRAYVVPVAGAVLRPDELLAAAARSLARFKFPSAIEVGSDQPHTVTGKIMKWQLGGEHSDGCA
jgi:long-chain acyl-CoA synthetase